ncbi:MAG: putative integral rane protein [Frankiaceae bacterium]|jgi:hypothetical protein|nr:putative integral rane protein [Frankiaceae bacterium]MDQ1727012.1 putative integral rane protein [Frankiaceae bacterium]
MSDFTLFVHVLVVLVVIGPVLMSVGATPRLIRGGSDKLQSLRWVHRTSTIYGWGWLLIFVTGIAAGASSEDHKLDEFWISLSAALLFVAFVLLLVVIKWQRDAIARIDRGDDALPFAGKIAAFGGIASLLVVAILGLMVWKPGSHT